MSTAPITRDNTLNNQVAGEIRAWMGRREMTQADVARALDENEMWVMRRIRGRQAMTIEDLQRIAAVLRVSVLDLFPPNTTNARLPQLNPTAPADRLIGRTSPHATIGLSPMAEQRRDPRRPSSPIPASRRRPTTVKTPTRPMAA